MDHTKKEKNNLRSARKLKSNVLVTGGAGYIGSHACKALNNLGYVPVTFDNLNTGWKETVKIGLKNPNKSI